MLNDLEMSVGEIGENTNENTIDDTNANSNDSSSKKLTFRNLISSTTKKIPNSCLSLQIIITKHVYTDASLDNDVMNAIFWIYYPSLCVFCILWEFFHAKNEYKDRKWSKCKKNGLSILSSFISVWIFIATSYFIQDGKPFSILFDYESHIASIIFYMSFLWISIILLIEHKTCNKKAVIPGENIQTQTPTPKQTQISTQTPN